MPLIAGNDYPDAVAVNVDSGYAIYCPSCFNTIVQNHYSEYIDNYFDNFECNCFDYWDGDEEDFECECADPASIESYFEWCTSYSAQHLRYNPTPYYYEVVDSDFSIEGHYMEIVCDGGCRTVLYEAVEEYVDEDE